MGKLEDLLCLILTVTFYLVTWIAFHFVRRRKEKKHKKRVREK